MLPTSAESTCQHAVDALEQLLGNADVHAVARGEPYAHARSATGKLSELEESLVLQCRFMCEQASMLLNRLRAGCVPGEITSHSDTVEGTDEVPKLRFLDFPLFVRKSGLLRERVRRVGSTLSSLKHVGLLSEGSLGRRVITERAFAALKELLDMILVVAATLVTTSSSSSSADDLCSRATKPQPPASAEDVQPSTTCSSSPGIEYHPRLTTEGVHGAPHFPSSAEPLCSLEERSLSGSPTTAARHTRDKVTPGDDETSSRCGSAEGSQIPCLGLQDASSKPKDVVTSTAPSSLPPHRDSLTFSASRQSQEDSMETTAAAHRIPLKELCASNAHLLAFRHDPPPPNAPLRILKSNVDAKTAGDALSSTRVTSHIRRFRGHLWHELLREDGNTKGADAVSIITTTTTTTTGAPILWKDVFAAEIGFLFGIPVQWVENVRLAEEGAPMLTESEQLVKFEVRLPASLDDDDVQMRIDQHEFIGMFVLCEKLQEKKMLEACGNSSNNDGPWGSVTSLDVGNLTPIDFGRTIAPGSDIMSDDNKWNTHGYNINHPSGNAVVSPVYEEMPLRDVMQTHEEIILAGCEQNPPMMEQDQPRELGLSKESSLLHQHVDGPAMHHTPQSSGRPDGTACPYDVPLMLPHRYALQQHELPHSLAMRDGGERLRPSSSSSSASPIRSCSEDKHKHKDDSDAADGTVNLNMTGDEGSICFGKGSALRNPSPISATRKEAVETQNSKESALLWLSTTHEKVFQGDRWDVVLEHNKDELLRTFVMEIVTLFELPEGSVRHVKFALGSLHATFDLFHDRYLHETEINALLAVFDFPRVRAVYQRCVGCSNTNASLHQDATGGSHIIDFDHSRSSSRDRDDVSNRNQWGNCANDGRCMKVFDANSHLPVSNRVLKDDESSNDYVDKIMLSTNRKVTSHVSGLQSHSQPVDVTSTPNNEPVTFTRLAILHDLPIGALVKANPHLAKYSSDDVLPSSENVVIPRLVMPDDRDRYLHNHVPVAVGGPHGMSLPVASSAQSSTPSQSPMCTPLHGDGGVDSPEKRMNLKNVAKKLAVTVSALRQRNLHFDMYGDTDPLPRNSSINIPAVLIAAPETASGFSSVASSPSSPALCFMNRKPAPPTAAITLQGGNKNTKLVSSWKKTPQKFVQHPTDDDEHGETSGPQPMQSPPIPFSHPGPGATMRATPRTSGQQQQQQQRPIEPLLSKKISTSSHSALRTETRPFSLDAAPRLHITRSSSGMSNAALRREHAVLALSRCTTQFLLLRFFVKWRCFVGTRLNKRPRRGRHLGIVLSAPQDGGKSLGVAHVDLHPRMRATKGAAGPTPRYVVSPRTGSARDRCTGIVTKSPSAVAQTQGHCSLPQRWAIENSTRKPNSARSKQSQLREMENFQSLLSARHSSLRRTSSSRNALPSRGESRTPTYSSSCISGTPRPSWSRTSSVRSASRASSLDKRLKPSATMRSGECLPLGLRVVSDSLVVVEVQAEAAEAGVQRGDEVREVDGICVHSLKEFRSAVASSISSHVILTVVKNPSGTLAAFRLQRRNAEGGSAFKVVSPRGFPKEPRITPAFGTERNTIMTSARVRSRSETSLPCAQQQENPHSTALSRDPHGRHEMRAR